MSAPPPPLGPGLAARRLRVPRDQVAFLRYLLEAEDGLGFLYGDGSGEVLLVTTESQLAGLDAWLADVVPLVRAVPVSEV